VKSTFIGNFAPNYLQECSPLIQRLYSEEAVAVDARRLFDDVAVAVAADADGVVFAVRY